MILGYFYSFTAFRQFPVPNGWLDVKNSSLSFPEAFLLSAVYFEIL